MPLELFAEARLAQCGWPGNSSVIHLAMQRHFEYGGRRCGFDTKHQSTIGVTPLSLSPTLKGVPAGKSTHFKLFEWPKINPAGRLCEPLEPFVRPVRAGQPDCTPFIQIKLQRGKADDVSRRRPRDSSETRESRFDCCIFQMLCCLICGIDQWYAVSITETCNQSTVAGVGV